MLLKQLRYFVTAAKLGSFTEAALECGVSQSAVSQQIKALETELGVELVARRNASSRGGCAVPRRTCSVGQPRAYPRRLSPLFRRR